MKKLRSINDKGFTIVELMIAISVFSIILLICISAIIYVGRLYYIGVSQAKVQGVARSSVDTLSDAIKFSADSVKKIEPTLADDWSGAYCIGVRKYSYVIGKVLTDNVVPDTKQTTQALVESIDPNCGSAGVTVEPVITDPSDIRYVPTRELLGKYMRINEFSIVQDTSTGLATITMSVVYGGDGTDADADIFNYKVGSDVIESCKTGVGGSQFCSFITFKKIVYGV